MKVDLDVRGGGARKELVEARAFPVMTAYNAPAPYRVYANLGSQDVSNTEAALRPAKWNDNGNAYLGQTKDRIINMWGIDLGEPKIITKVRTRSRCTGGPWNLIASDSFEAAKAGQWAFLGASLIYYLSSPNIQEHAVDPSVGAKRFWGAYSVTQSGTYYMYLYTFQLFMMDIV